MSFKPPFARMREIHSNIQRNESPVEVPQAQPEPVVEPEPVVASQAPDPVAVPEPEIAPEPEPVAVVDDVVVDDAFADLADEVAAVESEPDPVVEAPKKKKGKKSGD